MPSCLFIHGRIPTAGALYDESNWITSGLSGFVSPGLVSTTVSGATVVSVPVCFTLWDACGSAVEVEVPVVGVFSVLVFLVS